MQREYTTTFLGIKSDDIDDLITIRQRFDNLVKYRHSMNEINSKNDIEIQKEKYLFLIKDQENIEKEIEEIKYLKILNQINEQSEKIISFPYQSFLNLRYWHKAPKSLKIFFQALTCFFSISNQNFLTELKMNHNFIRNIQFYQPSSIVMDEFRMKYLNLYEISSEYIRNKSLDAYTIAIWIHNIEENERLNRIKQSQIEKQKYLDNKLNQLHQNLLNKQKDIQLIEYKIQILTKNIS